jgi:hypothetical protein
MSDNRDMGIEFGDLTDDLESEDYPISKAELLEKYGDRELGMPDGTTTLREVIGGEGEDTYEGQDEVHQVVLNMVGDEAVGRAEYSDRCGSYPNPDENEEESL